MDNKNNKRKNIFEEYIKPLLLYVGSIGAAFMSAAYIVLVLVLVFGFQVKSPTQCLVFAVVNALVGLIIMQFLKIQGVDFAKSLPENKELLEKYFKKRKKNKYYSINYFWVTSVIKDIIVKGFSIAITTTGIIYIVIEGSSDYVLILLAIVNLIMFICFGLLSLTKAYDFYNERHIPYIVEELNKVQKEKEAQDGIRDSKEWTECNFKELTGTSPEE